MEEKEVSTSRDELDFSLPCYIHIGNKKISLNLNWYRNAHFQILNKTKQLYFPISFEKFKAENIAVSYCLIWNSARRTDLMNWIAVADKYFMDWLVASRCIPDDNISIYGDVSASVVVDKTIKESYIRATVKIIK